MQRSQNMSPTLHVVLAQLNFLVGDIEENTEKIIHAIHTAHNDYQADLIVFPELTLSGYPPEDLLFRHELFERITMALETIKPHTHKIDVVLGYPESTVHGCFNKAVLIRHGEIVSNYYKQKLPNYSVFDEKRYFKPGSTPCVFDLKGIPTAITICEDLWYTSSMTQANMAGAKLMLSINASPFDIHKYKNREKIMASRAKEGNMPILYVNHVSGQDELVFDGGSMVIDQQGTICQQADFFIERLLPVEIAYEQGNVIVKPGTLPAGMSQEEQVYKALVLGVRDYIEKNNFPLAIIGLSGGIDSALTLAIAVDAVGKDRVETLLMPSRYSTDSSISDAIAQVQTMGVKYSIISIEPMFEAFLNSLAEEFKGYSPDTTEENLQARVRGTLQMAVSNKKHAIVLTTGNKSEMAVGYATLYGDMAGGFCVLKDIFKTMVYRLAHYRNSLSPVIPQNVLEKAPSAELAANQKDEDFLPPYSILDQILERYVERNQSAEAIIKAGFNENIVNRVVKMVDRNEYKRRQAAPGIRITERAFGKDWRYPITSGFGRNLK